MKSPFTGGDANLVVETRKFAFRKEEYECIYLCYQCADSGEKFTTTQLDTVNAAQVVNRYRSEHNIPFPDEIRETRSNYALSASKMSRILGFGENQYRLYENGEVPNIANGRLLRAIQSPKTFETFVDEAKEELNTEEYNKIKKRIEDCHARELTRNFLTNLIYGKPERNQYNGYAMQSISRLKNTMLFFIERFKGVFVTQMNKLLFYSDFLSYRENGEAITGLAYKAIQFGPVPNRWDKAYSLMEDIEQILVESKNGNTGNKLVSEMSCDLSCFTTEQLEVLGKVYETFKNDSPTSISNRSHNELAWSENVGTNSFIDFRYAFSLRAV